MERIDYELEQYQRSQEELKSCEVCGNSLPSCEFENESVCMNCEADGYWQAGMFIDAGGNVWAI